MRTPIIAGNWKMHKTIEESVDFAQKLAMSLAGYTNVERVVCPSFIALSGVAQALTHSDIKVGAQNMHWEKQGAYTSQISPIMLQGLAEYVIIGHSECRQFLGETDEMVNRKAKAALAHNLKPIVAVGENLRQFEANETEKFVSAQIRAAFDGLTAEDLTRVVIAYEPIWAIGTGKNASGEIANRIIGGTIRGTIRELYGTEAAEKVRIQYGGSVKPDNMREYMSQPEIDGALVGGASLHVDMFSELVRIASGAKGS